MPKAPVRNRFWFTESQELGFQQFSYHRRVIYPERLQDEYVIALCLQGRVDVSEGGVLQELNAGQVLIGNSLQRRRSEYGAHGPCEGLSLIVSPRMLQKCRGIDLSDPNAAVLPRFQGVKDARHLMRTVEDALDELSSDRPGKAQMLEALGQELLVRSVRAWDDNPNPASSVQRLLSRRHYVSALDYMQTHGKHEFSVESMCPRIGLNAGDFARLFRNCTGFSPLQVYNQLLIGRALEALQKGQQSMKEIAYGLGFQTPSHFTSLFRKVTGMAPTEVRPRS